MMPMRTTMTLDKDVSLKLRRLIHESGKSAREIINDLLRGALVRKSTSKNSGKTFKPLVYRGKGGLNPGFSWNMSTAQMLDQIDEEEFKSRKENQGEKH